MGNKTGIECVDRTYNPWQGCHPVSCGCDNCYMYREKKRYGQDPAVVVRSKDSTFYAPLKWKEPSRVFVNSWSDFFIKEADPWRAEVLEIIESCPQHTFIAVTKRTERIAESMTPYYLPEDFPSNLWLVATVENQEMANKRIPELLGLRNIWPEITVLGASYEPAVGPLDLTRIDCGDHYLNALTGEAWDDENGDLTSDLAYGRLGWAIAGGESGPAARPSHPDWFSKVRDDCETAGVPFFFKQHGEWQDIEDHFNEPLGDRCECWITGKGKVSYDHIFYSEDSHGAINMLRVGLKRAGRLLDGREHNGIPEVK